MPRFEVISPFKPSGDQPNAIATLSKGIESGNRFQTLKGITGSGKSATIAWTIEALQMPTLVMAPNKSLAAQLAGELRDFFPKNKVEFFVSYYDYYQPEAYVVSSDTFIEKDASINDEIDRLRHSATTSLLSRTDTIVVASVSAIYGLGSPESYQQGMVRIQKGDSIDIRMLLRRLVDLRYVRNDVVLSRGSFRVKGDTLEIQSAIQDSVTRISFFGDEVDAITKVDLLKGISLEELDEVAIFPATHYTTTEDVLKRAIKSIRKELDERLRTFQSQEKLLEAQRIEVRTMRDLDMIEHLGYCGGIENYSRHLENRQAGEAPFTLLDYFPKDYLVVIDESHVTVPQLNGQYAGDKSRKETLVEHGFRLPSALDNRPLRFEEFINKIPRAIYLSATPGPYELSHSDQIVEQVIRPTGLLDPVVEVRPTTHQVDDLVEEIRENTGFGFRTLVTTLTKKMSEDLADYMADLGLRVRYLHSDIGTVERIELLRDLRRGVYDVLVGINLLREGLDLPEVALVAILDADKEGFLRSETSLIQTIGRAARNSRGKVIMYADRVTRSMQAAMDETTRRRTIQVLHNEENGLRPVSIQKEVLDLVEQFGINVPHDQPKGRGKKQVKIDLGFGSRSVGSSISEMEVEVSRLEDLMNEAAEALEFEKAAFIRDELFSIKALLEDLMTDSLDQKAPPNG
ncbi:MAG: excinuclease ABC subunit UvrB [Acidimicrobiales bacterium]|nr:excinuclease ABC subunit UvrB [Acidimicrobiales bacterium]